ncbi:MAG: GTP 3',8-cyclase MoaA [Vicinamibacterales bacterium]
MALVDTLGRPLRSLRVSVTDRCNLRCEYCMPEADYVWLSRDDLLHFEETSRLVDIFIRLGVDKIRLTGGEPLLRRNLCQLVEMLAGKPLDDLALTTNGILLEEFAQPLRRAGLRRLNISLDTLDPERFVRLTRQRDHARVMRGILAASRIFDGTKLDAVIMRGVNDDELEPLLDFAASIGAEVRFIEYMDVGGATRWSSGTVVPRAEILGRLAKRFGRLAAVEAPRSTAPADRFALPDGRVFGVIASTSAPFCRTCDRARVTADGILYTCLYAAGGLALRPMLRGGEPDKVIAGRLEARWSGRADRGAEERAGVRERAAFVPVSALRADPHLEMHKRGG